jgi:hypothetical protein
MSNTSKDEKLDRAHEAVEESQPDPTTQTQDCCGIVPGHTQQAETAPEDCGGEAERDVKTSSKATLGRHVTSDDGLDIAKRRHSHIKQVRKQNEKVFTKKK